MKIYFAGPLFSEAERDWIRATFQKIESFAAGHGTKLEIIFPYDLITQSEIDSFGAKAKLEIFSRCNTHLDDMDLLISLLDGPQMDDGTAWEIGYFSVHPVNEYLRQCGWENRSLKYTIPRKHPDSFTAVSQCR